MIRPLPDNNVSFCGARQPNSSPRSPQRGVKGNPDMSYIMLSDSQMQPEGSDGLSSTSVKKKPASKKAEPQELPDGSNELGRHREMTTRLFEILSARSDIDHPICSECTDLLLEGLQKRQAGVTRERDAYVEFLKKAQQDIPTDEEKAKTKQDLDLKKHEIKLGFMSAFARASVLALQEIPAANASIEGDTIVYRDYVDLSVAVATPKGLVTPVVRNAEQMGFIDIEKEIAALSKKARDGKLTIEDMAGGSFTMYVVLCACLKA